MVTHCGLRDLLRFAQERYAVGERGPSRAQRSKAGLWSWAYGRDRESFPFLPDWPAAEV